MAHDAKIAQLEAERLERIEKGIRGKVREREIAESLNPSGNVDIPTLPETIPDRFAALRGLHAEYEAAPSQSFNAMVGAQVSGIGGSRIGFDTLRPLNEAARSRILQSMPVDTGLQGNTMVGGTGALPALTPLLQLPTNFLVAGNDFDSVGDNIAAFAGANPVIAIKVAAAGVFIAAKVVEIAPDIIAGVAKAASTVCSGVSDIVEIDRLKSAGYVRGRDEHGKEYWYKRQQAPAEPAAPRVAPAASIPQRVEIPIPTQEELDEFALSVDDGDVASVPNVHQAAAVQAETVAAVGEDEEEQEAEPAVGGEAAGAPTEPEGGEPDDSGDEGEKESANRNHFSKQSREELLRSKTSHEKLIKEHKEKLEAYEKNPDTYDNKNLLKGVSQERRNKIIQGRIKELQRQIRKQENGLKIIDQLLG